MFPLVFPVFLKIPFSLIISIVFGVPKINNTEHNIYLLNCLLLCARFVIYKCKYGNRIPTALEFYQQVQKVKTSECILSKNRSKINLFRKKWSILL